MTNAVYGIYCKEAGDLKDLKYIYFPCRWGSMESGETRNGKGHFDSIQFINVAILDELDTTLWIQLCHIIIYLKRIVWGNGLVPNDT